MPVYKSESAITFGGHRDPEPAWDFVWPAGSAAPEGVSAEIVEATRAVGHDLLASAEVRAQFPELDWAYRVEDRALSFINRQTCFFLTEQSLSAMATTVMTADAVHFELTGYKFVQWPMCPSHQHPMNASVVDGAAWWTCMRTGEPVCRIGESV
jgi:hypothetical protein